MLCINVKMLSTQTVIEDKLTRTKKHHTCLPVRRQHPWQPLLSHAVGGSHLQRPISPHQIIR